MKQEHNDTTPFKCDHPGCDFRTSQSAGLNNHSKVHRTYRKDLISIMIIKIIHMEPLSYSFYDRDYRCLFKSDKAVSFAMEFSKTSPSWMPT